MFKNALAVFFLCVSLLPARAQDYPKEWKEYDSPLYFSSIQNGNNPKKMPDEAYLKYLSKSAISALASQLEVRVRDVASLSKSSYNGKSSVSYVSNASFQTDIRLRLVRTFTYHPKKSKIWAAVAFISKTEAREYFKKDIEEKIGEAERFYQKAKDYEVSGYKTKAREELGKAVIVFPKTDESFFWLKLCGFPEADYTSLLNIRNELDVLVQQELTLLGHATVIYMECITEGLASPNRLLEGSLKSKLSSKDRSFTDDKSSADWVITITASAREDQITKIGNITSYFSYVDAYVSLSKVSTSQMIYENTFSLKGGDTRNFTKAADQAYKDLLDKLFNELAKRIE